VSGTANRRIGGGRHPSRGTLILGLGNPLRGDDGIGSRVVDELTRRRLPETVQIVDAGTAGLDLLHMMEGAEQVVIVDAADLGRESGQFVRFTPREAQIAQATDGFSLHNSSLSEVLALADALGRTLPEMVVFGVQIANIGWGEGLSPAVEAAIPALVDAVIEEIEKGENHAQDSGN
jgi:hydrogenase maturation protease